MKRRATLVLLCSLALSACGFKLKGLYEVPEALQQLVMVEQSAQPTALGRELVKQLSGSGVVISESAPYRLELGTARYNKRALTLSGTADALEYELSGSVEFALYSSDNEVPLIERTVRAERSFSARDPDNTATEVTTLALETIESSYTTELNRALADQIVRQYLSYAPAN